MERSLFLAIVLVTALICPFASADPILIGDLDDPQPYSLEDVNLAGGIRVEDKVFSDFRVSPTALANALVPDETSINVTPVEIEGEYGLRFDGPWSAGAGDLADTTIIFSVEADLPWLITDNTLKMTGYLADNGGMVTISETVYLRDPDQYNDLSIAQKGVYYDSASEARKEIDHQEFRDQDTGEFIASPVIWVVKDVGANGGLVGDQGIAKISSFYQTFSQIPEPAAATLLAAGIVGLLRRRR